MTINYDGEVPDLEVWGMQSTPSLPLLPGPLWPRMVAPDRVLSMGQTEQTVCKQMTDAKSWLLYSNTWNHLTVCKSSDSFKNSINKLSLQVIYLIHMYKQDLALNNLQWLICHKTKPNQIKPKLSPKLTNLYLLKEMKTFTKFLSEGVLF